MTKCYLNQDCQITWLISILSQPIKVFLVRKHLNTLQIYKLTDRLTHGHFAQFEIPRQFLSFLKTCLPIVWRHVYPVFTTMFAPYLRTCLHNVYIYVYTMVSDKLTPYYKICLHNVRTHVYKIFGYIVDQCFKTCLHYVLNYSYPRHTNTKFQKIFM